MNHAFLCRVVKGLPQKHSFTVAPVWVVHDTDVPLCVSFSPVQPVTIQAYVRAQPVAHPGTATPPPWRNEPAGACTGGQATPY